MRLVVGSHHSVAVLDASTGEVIDERRLTNPSFVARHGQWLYVVDEAPDALGTVHAFAWGADGLRSHGEPQSSRGAQPCHVSVRPDGRQLLVSNYGDGNLTVLPLRDNGSIQEPSHVVSRVGSGPIVDRQAGPHAHQMVTDPSHNWVLACDLGTDQVAIYRFNRAEATLSPHDETHLGGGEGPRHLTFTSPRQAWVATELGSNVVWCDWDASTGTLRPRGRVSTRRGTNTNYPGAIVADNERLYVTNRGEDSVCVIDIASGSVVAHHPCGGEWPRDACLAQGRLFVANERSGEVSSLDLATGQATRVAKFDGVTSVMALP